MANNKNIINIGGGIEIYPDKMVGKFSRPNAIAYEASNSKTGAKAFALIVPNKNIPRLSAIKKYSAIKNASLIALEYATIIEWVDGKQYFAFVYGYPTTDKIIPDYNQDFSFSLRSDKLIKPIIEPGLKVLEDFENKGITHGNVSLDNMFFTGDRLLIGECLSSAASSSIPVLFETISKSLCHPMGRGNGTIKDDLYSFGVSIAILLRGYNLLKNRSDDDIIQEKMAKGTYSALIGKERLPGKVSEFLRGVLNDHVEQRWDLEDAINWLDGKQRSNRKSVLTFKAARPYIYNDNKISYLNVLSHEFSKDMKLANLEVKKDKFLSWVDRSFQDNKVYKKIEKAHSESRDLKTNIVNTDVLTSKTLMAMDQNAPLRYKNIASFPHALGNLMAYLLMDKQDIRPFSEILGHYLFNFWLDIKDEPNVETTILTRGIDKARGEITRTGFGSGFERVIYMLSYDCACISPKFEDYFVSNAGDLLLTLEKMASRGDLDKRILDNHMIAYLIVREPKLMTKFLKLLGSSDDGNYFLGLVELFSKLQIVYKTGPLPNLQLIMIDSISPITDKIHSVELHKRISKSIKKLDNNGIMLDILSIIDDSKMIQVDETEFSKAQRLYANLEYNKQVIGNRLKGKNSIGKVTGKQVSMLISFLFSIFIIMGYFVMNFVVEK